MNICVWNCWSKWDFGTNDRFTGNSSIHNSVNFVNSCENSGQKMAKEILCGKLFYYYWYWG